MTDRKPTPDSDYDIVARILAATGSSKSLDREVYSFIGCEVEDTGRMLPNGEWQPRWTIRDPEGRFGQSPKSFTGFLDDAICLFERVLPAWDWSAGNSEHRGWAEVWVPGTVVAERTYAETPAIALTAATIRAFAALSSMKGGG